MDDRSADQPVRSRPYGPWLLLAIVLLVVILVRVRLAALPLERDEGEFALAGQAILRGSLPYQYVYNMKLPGVYYAYAGIMAVFGRGPVGIHLGAGLVSLASTGFLVALVHRLRGAWTAAFAGAAFAVLSVSPSVLGIVAHATHFVLLPALAGYWLLVREGAEIRRRTALAAGLLFGLTFLMKQPGLFLVLGGAVVLVQARWRPAAGRIRRLARDLGLLAAGALLPCLLILAMMAKGGLLHRFWFWTVTYAIKYGTYMTLRQGMILLVGKAGDVMGASLLLWLAAGIGLVMVWRDRRARTPLLAVALGGFLGVFPGLFFRPHYFILALPGVACLAAIALEGLHARLERRLGTRRAFGLTVLAGLAALAQPLVHDDATLFRDPMPTVSRNLYASVTPFAESRQIADYIARHCAPDAKIAVIGSEPQILFYANRPSATGYIYTYALMEPQPFALDMQKEMVAEVEKADPEYLVYINMASSWLVGPASRLDIFHWVDRYAAQKMTLVGAVAVSKAYPTQFVWDPPAGGEVVLNSPQYVAIFRRR